MGYLAGCQSSPNGQSFPQGVILTDGPGLDNIQAVTDKFLRASNERNAVGCASTYSKDAIFMPQGYASVEGRDNIQEFFDEHEWEVSEGIFLNIEEEVEGVFYFGEWDVMRGFGEITTIENEIEDNYRFKWVMLSKKNEKGEWDSVWDIFNDI